jgi:hypothetical protein
LNQENTQMSKRTDRRLERREHKDDEGPRGSNLVAAGLRQMIILVAVAFVVTLGVVVGTRMSSDAIAVLVGVIAGVAASIPCALLLMAVTRRRQTEAQEPYPADSGPYPGRFADRPGYEQRHAAPPVIIVTPGSASPQQLSPWNTTSGPADLAAFSPYAYGSAQLQGQREFRVMGYEEGEDRGDGDWGTDRGTASPFPK